MPVGTRYLRFVPRTFYGSAQRGDARSPGTRGSGFSLPPLAPGGCSWSCWLRVWHGLCSWMIGFLLFFFVDKFGWVFSFWLWWCVALRAWGRFVIGRVPWAGIKFHWKIAREAAAALGSLRHLWFFFVSDFFLCLHVSSLLSFKQLPTETGKRDRLLHTKITETKTGCVWGGRLSLQLIPQN